MRGLLGAVRPSPDQARDWARDELAHPEYHRQSLISRVLSWLRERIDEILHAASGASPLSAFAGLAIALVVVALLIYLLPRIRRDGARVGVTAEVLATDDDASAAVLRARAQAARAEGRHRDAVADGYRSLARRGVETGSIEASAGSTAHELAGRLAAVHPVQAGDLARAADLFDAVVYGDHEAAATDADFVLRLADTLAPVVTR